MAKVTGVGGVFFKARDPQALAAWYRQHLGVPVDSQMGFAILPWGDDPGPDGGLTVWSLSPTESEWFQPSPSTFMINYRVDDMAGLLEQLKAANIPILKGPDTEFNGIFAWILDPEGNKVELWQPFKIEAPPSA